MKCILSLFFIVCHSMLWAQTSISVTESFSIQGKIKNEMNISITDLSSYKPYSIDSIAITNHRGERKESLKEVKGVLLKDILGKTEFDAENPKILNEYYIVCIAVDNYKVVFSWNEIFNSKTGDAVYILTGHDGKPAAALDDRITLICSNDQMTGRRYVKGLQKIIVERVK